MYSGKIAVPPGGGGIRKTSQHNQQLNTSRQSFTTRFQILRKHNDKFKCLNCQDDTNILKKNSGRFDYKKFRAGR
jgi:hypothetical protein